MLSSLFLYVAGQSQCAYIFTYLYDSLISSLLQLGDDMSALFAQILEALRDGLVNAMISGRMGRHGWERRRKLSSGAGQRVGLDDCCEYGPGIFPISLGSSARRKA